MNSIFGIDVIPSHHAVQWQQFRFPRTKRKRIRAKWAARSANYKEIPIAFMLSGSLVCHPEIVRRYTDLLNKL